MFSSFLRSFRTVGLGVASLLVQQLTYSQAIVTDDCPDYGLHFETKPTGGILARWNAEAGTVQLMRTNSLGFTSWVPGPTPRLATDGSWEADIGTALTRSFFQLQPVSAPSEAPANVRLVIDGDHFRLEWDSACEAAGYVVYVGTNPTVGPSSFTKRVVLGQANSLIIDGLTDGQLYYVTVAHANRVGIGPTAAAQSAVFGPNGPVSGLTLRSVTQTSGKIFDVEAENVSITLTPTTTLRAGGGPAPTGLSQRKGAVFIPHVPVGQYFIDWTNGAASGRRPSVLTVTPKGASFGNLNVTGTTAGTTLFGTIRTTTGANPYAWNLPNPGVLTATAQGGQQRTMIPDTRGRWLFTGIPNVAYPVTLSVTFGPLTATTTVNTPPTSLSPISLVFAQVLPKVLAIRPKQNGVVVQRIKPGVPVEFVAEIDNPANLPISPKWTFEHKGNVQESTTGQATFTLVNKSSSPPDVNQDGGSVRGQVDLGIFGGSSSIFDIPVENSIQLGCYSGRVAIWDPALPDTLSAAHPATVTISRDGGPDTVVNTISDSFGGYFETFVDPFASAPYKVRVEKEGYMRFLWPFSDKLPNEPQLCLIPTQTFQRNTSAGAVTITYEGNGAQVQLPANSLRTAAGTVYNGAYRVSLVSFDPGVRHPFPPGPETRIMGVGGIITSRSAMKWLGFMWISIKDLAGNPLTPTSGTLSIPTNVTQGNPPTLDFARQSDTTGYFVASGSATRAAGNIYTAPLTNNGLHIVHIGKAANTLEIEADRTLNYPFDVLLGGSFWPVTIQGISTNSLGRFTVPFEETIRLKVLDVKEAPGVYFDNPGNPTHAVPPFNKTVIVSKTITANTNAIVPATAPIFKEIVSIADSAPELAPEVGTIDGKEFFLSRHENTKAESDAYYAKIKAPATLLEWRRLNNFPDNFGAAMPNVPPENYATAYYYNLADLGFARAQTMRIKNNGGDGQKDVAFAVTNYPSLEEARCGTSAIATVCMDYAYRTDDQETQASRYTRFYVYDAKGDLLAGADLDNSGKKRFVPNLCVMCHGGTPYEAGDSPNLGSRFLPFDLESYSFHPNFGVQHTELARMNEGVRLTDPTDAIEDLIVGWYNGSPTVNATTFLKGYVPSAAGLSWSGSATQSDLYRQVFKHSCRVCHISRETGGIQFDSYDAFDNMGFGASSACGSLSMPQAQRTWSHFWGSRSGHSILGSVIDQPTELHTISGNAGTCP